MLSVRLKFLPPATADPPPTPPAPDNDNVPLEPISDRLLGKAIPIPGSSIHPVFET